MEKQPEHRRRQLKPAHATRFEQPGFPRRPELLESVADLCLEGCYQRGGVRLRRSGLRLPLEERSLLLGELLPSGIGEKPVQAARRMADMEPHGSGPTGADPQVVGRERPDDSLHLFLGLEQGVGDGLEQGRNVGDGTAQPDFGWSLGCHEEKITEGAGRRKPPPGYRRPYGAYVAT